MNILAHLEAAEVKWLPLPRNTRLYPLFLVLTLKRLLKSASMKKRI
jgi:hypothetical protein